MAGMNGKLFVTGGRDDDENRLKTGEVLDLATMQWESLPEMKTQRSVHGKCKAACYEGGMGVSVNVM